MGVVFIEEGEICDIGADLFCDAFGFYCCIADAAVWGHSLGCAGDDLCIVRDTVHSCGDDPLEASGVFMVFFIFVCLRDDIFLAVFVGANDSRDDQHKGDHHGDTGLGTLFNFVASPMDDGAYHPCARTQR